MYKYFKDLYFRLFKLRAFETSNSFEMSHISNGIAETTDRYFQDPLIALDKKAEWAPCIIQWLIAWACRNSYGSQNNNVSHMVMNFTVHVAVHLLFWIMQKWCNSRHCKICMISITSIYTLILCAQFTELLFIAIIFPFSLELYYDFIRTIM